MKADLSTPLDGLKFSFEEIHHQLQRIFLDSSFHNSDILRKFLSFIVEQTLSGHADWLKEYTIGVNVLNKPADFKPQDNGIVRIHAGRLRRALHNYYKTIGSTDPIRISIPKGRYVPLFLENSSIEANEGINMEAAASAVPSSVIAAKKTDIIAVLPFQHFNNDAMENSLIDGLGLQLTNALQQFENCSVMAYYTMQDVWKKTNDISELASLTNIKYAVSGCIQTVENKIRLHIQIIDLHNCMQVWSTMYEGTFTCENIFKIQDQMVQFIISELIKSRKFVTGKTKLSALVAVA